MFDRIKQFVEREGITPVRLINPIFSIDLLIRYRYVHFFVVGMTGVAINLGLTWFFTEFVFGKEHYFEAYLIGLGGNLVYNFTLHTIITFGTTQEHLKRFLIFIVYALFMTVFQAYLVKVITPLVGIDYYLFVIGAIILFFSTISFFVFKLSVFKKLE